MLLSHRFLIVAALLLVVCDECHGSIEFLVEPQNTVIALGDDLWLDCGAKSSNSSELLIYSWRFKGRSIPKRSLVFANNSLLVPDVTALETGWYQCVVYTDSESGGSTQIIVSSRATVIAAYIDDFVMNPTSINVTEGADIILECVTGKSSPSPSVYWEFNGHLFTEGQQDMATYGQVDELGLSVQYSLRLEVSAFPSHDGIFTCVSRNPMNGVERRSKGALISVYVLPAAPVIKVHPPRNVISPLGRTLMIPCEMQGVPDPFISWSQGNVDITPSARRFVMSNGSLYFHVLDDSDAGRYRCKGNNSVGDVESTFSDLTVASMDVQFEQHPSSVEALVGEGVTLVCRPPASIPPALVTWYKDVEVVPVRLETKYRLHYVDARNGIWDLRFQNVLSSDDGEYYCVAYNNFSRPKTRTSHIAKLTVTGAPAISDPPVDKVLTIGALLQLTCRAEGNPPPQITWSHEGEPVEAGLNTIIRNDNQEIWISDVTKLHQGTYTCTATNDFGQQSAKAYVTILVFPVIVTPVGKVIGTAGKMVLLPCKAYGDPAPDIKWYKDGVEVMLPGDGSMSLVSDGLYIDNATIGNEGNYTCQASNVIGEALSEGHLVIHVAPVINDSLSDVSVKIGDSVEFLCLVTGVPKPSIAWLYNNSVSLPTGVSMASDGSQLLISAASWQHTGQYTCIARNPAGTAMQSVMLYIREPPVILSIEGNTALGLDESLALNCLTTGLPPPTTRWQHNTAAIVETSDGRITFPESNGILVKFVTKSDTGNYTCIASNIVGEASKVVQVNVIGRPKPPVLLAAIQMSTTSISLSWAPVTQDPHTNVQYFIIRYKQRAVGDYVVYHDDISMTSITYEVDGLLPGVSYVFTVSARNHIGSSLPSNPIQATTFESAPSQPNDFQVVSTAATSVMLSWEVPTITNGKISRYQLQYKEKTATTAFLSTIVEIPAIPLQKHHLPDLRPYTTYSMRVRAATMDNGLTMWGAFSSVLKVTTAIAAPTGSPQNVNATALSERTINVQWKQVALELRNGPLKSYIITYWETGSGEVVNTMYISASKTTVNITQLQPWTEYEFSVEAENEVGNGPASAKVLVKSMPEAPSGSPRNLQLTVMTSTTIEASWEPVPELQRHSDITGYIVEYTHAGATNATNERMTINELAVNLTDLDPWTAYEVRVQAFTLQISQGEGPLSSPQTATTFEDVPSSVQNVSSIVAANEITLHWDSPASPNGVLLGYVVRYRRVNSIAGDNSTEDTFNFMDQEAEGEFDPSILTTQQTTGTSIILAQIQPSTTYAIAITAETRAGEGDLIEIVVTTLAVPINPPPPVEYNAESLAEISTLLMTTPTPTSSSLTKDLPVIVAGSLTAGFVLLFIFAAIVYVYMRRKRMEKEQRCLLSRVAAGDLSSFPEVDSKSEINSDHNADSTGQYDIHVMQDDMPSSSTQSKKPDTPHITVSNDSDSYAGRYAVFKHTKQEARYTAHHGVVNPGFVEDIRTSPEFPIPEEEVYSQAELNNRKKNRMRSESAAAIAIMRNSAIATVGNDTESLITNELVVVYDERTAL